MPRRSCQFGVALVAMFSFLSLPAPASAIGYFNLPGNFCQCVGYGCGPGYHAPMVLGPPSMCGCCAHHVHRLWHPPGPPCDCTWWGGDCGDCGCDPGAPSMLEPTPVPAPLPEAVPAAYRVPFRN